MNFLFKLLLSIKKHKLVIVLKNENSEIIELTSFVLKDYVENKKINFPLNKNNFFDFVKSKTFIIESNVQEEKQLNELMLLIKRSSYIVLVLERELSKKDFKAVNKISKLISSKGIIITDSKNSKEIKSDKTNIFKVGLNEEFDLWASDLNISENTNFKVGHRGDVIPFWFNKPLNQNKIKSILFSIAVGMSFNLNLVEISQKLRKSMSND